MTTAPTTIDTDLPCHTCRYNLRTRLPTDNCPECNTPIAASLLAQHRRALPHNRVATTALLLFIAEFSEGATLLIVIILRHLTTRGTVPPIFYGIFIHASRCFQSLCIAVAILAVRRFAPAALRGVLFATSIYLCLAVFVLSQFLKFATYYFITYPYINWLFAIGEAVDPIAAVALWLCMLRFLLHLVRHAQYRHLRRFTAAALLPSMLVALVTSIFAIVQVCIPAPPAFMFTLAPYIIWSLSAASFLLSFYWLAFFLAARRHAHAPPITL